MTDAQLRTLRHGDKIWVNWHMPPQIKTVDRVIALNESNGLKGKKKCIKGPGAGDWVAVTVEGETYNSCYCEIFERRS